MIKPKHVPIRTCVACRTSDAKRGLLRIVRLADGTAAYDPKGKMPGRGAYVCAQIACISLARKQKKLERSLKIPQIPEPLFQELELQCDTHGQDSGPLAPPPDDAGRTGLPKSRSRPASESARPETVISNEHEREAVSGGRPRESEE